ncbi:MAG: methyltransferase domain-containing protein [Gemmatimonadaceae bacterium]
MTMASLLAPPRRNGTEILDGNDLDPRLVRRSMRDVARANAIFGGASALLAELEPALRGLAPVATLLDVGTGLGDIPARARARARISGVELRTTGADIAPELAAASAARIDAAVCADALQLPFADDSFDIVTCSQVLHHFPGASGAALLREMNRVARLRVVISDLRRSWTAAAGLWIASFPLFFHPVSRHDGVVSVLRGFTPDELERLVDQAVGTKAPVSKRFVFRVTTSWRPQ